LNIRYIDSWFKETVRNKRVYMYRSTKQNQYHRNVFISYITWVRSTNMDYWNQIYVHYIAYLRWNCLLKQLFEGEIKEELEVTRRRRSRRKKLLDDLEDRRGYSHLKKEALDRTMWRNCFGRGVGPVVRQITAWMNIVYAKSRTKYRSYVSLHQLTECFEDDINGFRNAQDW
jgi:hypothetical protein